MPHQRIKEEGCIAITGEKKYYEYPDVPGGSVFIKRNLTPSEYLVNRATGHLCMPDMIMKRMKNEAATIRYIQAHTIERMFGVGMVTPFPRRTSAAHLKTTGVSTLLPISWRA